MFAERFTTFQVKYAFQSLTGTVLSSESTAVTNFGLDTSIALTLGAFSAANSAFQSKSGASACELCGRLAIVGQRGIALLDSREVGCCDRGLERHYMLRIGRGLTRRFADEHKIVRDMLHIRITQRYGVRVGLEIVVAIGKSDASLSDASYHLAAVLAVLSRTEPEQHSSSRCSFAYEVLLDVSGRIDCGDLCERTFDGFVACLLDRGGIHAGGVEIPDLSNGRIRRSSAMRGSVVEDLSQLFVVVVSQLVECAPLGVGSRDRVGFHPATVRELVKVRARRTGGVQIGTVEWLCLPVRALCASGTGEERGRGNQSDRNATHDWVMSRVSGDRASVLHGASPIFSLGAWVWLS